MAKSKFQRNFLCLDSRKGASSFCRISFEVNVVISESIIISCYNLVSHLYRYGLPVNFQAILIHPNKKSVKRLRDVLNQLYSHLDGSASAPSSNADVRPFLYGRNKIV